MATRRRRAEERSTAVWSSACGWLLVPGAAGSRVARQTGSRRRACVWWRTGPLLRSAASPAPLVASQGAREIETPTFISSRRTSLFFRASILASRHSPRQPSPAPHTFCHTSSLHLLMLVLAGLPCFLHSCSICSALRHLRLADLCALKSAPAMLRRRDTGAIAMRDCERHRLSFERSSLRTRARTRARAGARAACEGKPRPGPERALSAVGALGARSLSMYSCVSFHGRGTSSLNDVGTHGAGRCHAQSSASARLRFGKAAFALSASRLKCSRSASAAS